VLSGHEPTTTDLPCPTGYDAGRTALRRANPSRQTPKRHKEAAVDTRGRLSVIPKPY